MKLILWEKGISYYFDIYVLVNIIVYSCFIGGMFDSFFLEINDVKLEDNGYY